MAREEEKLKKQKQIIERDYEKAKKCFNAKNIVLFDAKSISYEETKEPQPTQ